MTSLGFDLFLLLTPLFLAAIVALLGFVGCDVVLGIAAVQGPVTNLQAIPGNSQVTLSWDKYKDLDGNDATDYHVVRSTGGGALFDQDTASTALTFVDTGLANGTTYTYYVYALSSDGQSGASNSVNATPNAAISFVQMQPASQATNPPISVALSNTGAGNLLIAAVSYGGPAAGSVSVSDNLGNAFALVGSGPWFRQSRIFFLPNIPGGNVTITATAAGGASGPCSLCVSEYTGADLTSAALYGFSTKASPGTGTPGVEPIQGLVLSLAQAGDVAYVVVFATQPTSLSAGSAFAAHNSPTTSLLVEDSLISIAATDTVATLNGGAAFVPWVALTVGIKP
jgi:hypothetical protein